MNRLAQLLLALANAWVSQLRSLRRRLEGGA
jgi:hypothetical protein